MANQESVTTFKIQDYFTSAMQKIMASADKFEGKVKSMQGKAGTSFDGMKNNLEKFKIKNMEVIDSVAGQVPALGGNMALLANPYAAAAAGVLAVGAGIVKATQYAQQWETKMAEVNVTAGMGKKELKGLSDELLAIGGRNVAPLEQVPEAFNRILSAGLDVNTSLAATEPTLRAAKAGFADMATTAAAGVGVMNASGENINRVYDILFATLNKGNAKFNDIAQYLPKIVPAAKQAGFALGETAGAWAYFTAQGMTAERSTTLMENAIKSLSSPDKINAFNKMGIAIFDINGRMLPLTNIVDQLSGKMTGLTDKQRVAKLAALGLDTEAAGAFASMSQNAGKFKEIINATTNSTGALDKAYKDAAQSGDAWAVISNKFKVIWEKIGEKFLPLVEKAGKWVLGIIDGFTSLYNSSIMFRDAIGFIGDAFGWLLKISFGPLTLIWNMFSNIGSAIGWVADKLGFAGGAGEGFYLKMRPYLVWMYQMFGKIADIAYKVFTGDFTGAFKGLKNFKMPDMKEIRKQQSKEVAEMASKSKIKDNNSKSLNPAAVNPNGLDLSGIKGDKKKGGAREGGVSGGGTKQITINIQHLVSGVTINAMQMREGVQDLGRMIQEELTKALADTSLSIANE